MMEGRRPFIAQARPAPGRRPPALRGADPGERLTRQLYDVERLLRLEREGGAGFHMRLPMTSGTGRIVMASLHAAAVNERPIQS